MKIFHCDHCRQLVFFENVHCLNCHHPLGFLPDLGVVGSLEAAGENQWRSPIPSAQGRTYRLCANYEQANVCNWVVVTDDPDPLCESCRLTRVIPDLNVNGNREAWYRLEVAKRRLIYTVKNLGLPLLSKKQDEARGLAFEFLADQPDGKNVFTGHSDGLITLNIAEANDAERERRRVNLHEPYRTLLGHFRHEIGHYYWNVLIENSPLLERYRQIFGDETANYADAMKYHYANGAPAGWQSSFISEYATMHPWEDWAETWAHYLHMSDTLEMAQASGLSIQPRRADDPSLEPSAASNDFDQMIRDWIALTYVLNNLNRGLGLLDGYPFVLSTPVIEKLRFIHEVISERHTADTRAASDTGLRRAANQ
jgi:hypothetical protein